ncbi:sensor histidine kinase [Brevibacillus ginsengisoli]|uniref:sensor histidine kinase n=1 Tax=Brevibacillus ginsengisoli TaxID=363854 RepID=UPI003CEE1C07
MMDLLIEMIFMDIPQAFLVLMAGMALFNESLLAKWRKGAFFAVVYGLVILVLNLMNMSYEPKVLILLLTMIIMVQWLFRSHLVLTIMISISAFVAMMLIEFMVILFFQMLHIHIDEIMANPLYLYFAMWSIFLILSGVIGILRHFHFNLMNWIPNTRLNTYLALLIVSISLEFLLMMTIATRYYLVATNNLTMFTIRNIPVLPPIMLLLFLVIIVLFVRYLLLKVTYVETETKLPYLKSIDDLVHAIHSVQNDESRHYKNILTLLENGKQTETVEYINQLFKKSGNQHHNYSHLSFKEVKDPSVVSLLQSKLAYCLSNQVSFTYEIKSQHQFQHMKTIDIVKLLGNLLDNAIRATMECDEPSKIRLVWTETDQEESLCIENSGPTIPQEALQKLFDLGYTTKKTTGGVGLSVVNSIVKQYKGKISVYSKDSWTNFQIVYKKSF